MKRKKVERIQAEKQKLLEELNRLDKLEKWTTLKETPAFNEKNVRRM
jgi:hypothetical protein